jgi:hypothetical protein
MQPALTDYTAGAGVAAAEAALAARAFSHDNRRPSPAPHWRKEDAAYFAALAHAALNAGWDSECVAHLIPNRSGQIVARLTVTSPVAGNA